MNCIFGQLLFITFELENDVRVTTMCHSFLSLTFSCPCFTEMLLIFILTLFLEVGWIVTPHHATCGTDGRSISTISEKYPCVIPFCSGPFAPSFLCFSFFFFDFPSPCPLYFLTSLSFSILFDTCQPFSFSPHSPPSKFTLSLQLYSFSFSFLFHFQCVSR